MLVSVVEVLFVKVLVIEVVQQMIIVMVSVMDKQNMNVSENVVEVQILMYVVSVMVMQQIQMNVFKKDTV